MNQNDLRDWMRTRRLKDEWWVAVDGETLPNPLNLATLMTRKKQYQSHKMVLLNTGVVGTSDESWIDFEYTEESTPKLSLHGRLNQNIANQEVVSKLDAVSKDVAAIRSTVDDFKMLIHDMNSRVDNLAQHIAQIEAGQNISAQVAEMEAAKAEIEQRLKDLENREDELSHREKYISTCEERLIDIAYQQEETAAEIATISEGKTIPLYANDIQD